MKKNSLIVALAVLCLCACAPKLVHLPDGTTAYRVGCLDAEQCKKKANEFCKGPYRIADQQFGTNDVSRSSTRLRSIYDPITKTTTTTELPVSDVDSFATGYAIVQCPS